MKFFKVVLALIGGFATATALAAGSPASEPAIPKDLSSWKVVYQKTCTPVKDKVVHTNAYVKGNEAGSVSVTVMDVNGAPVDVMFMLFAEGRLVTTRIYVKSQSGAWTIYNVGEGGDGFDDVLPHTLSAIGITAEQHANCKSDQSAAPL